MNESVRRWPPRAPSRWTCHSRPRRSWASASGAVALRRGFGRWRRELLGFRASRHGARGMGAGTDGGLNRIEIAGADEGLVLGGAVTGRFLTELALLQLGISQHAVVAGCRCQLEHREIERVPAPERDELKAIAHGGQFFPPAFHGRGRQFGLPIEGRRAVVGPQLA